MSLSLVVYVANFIIIVIQSRRDERLTEQDFRPSRDSPPRLEPLPTTYLVKLGSIDSS
jgi:hypothetical protein